MSTPEEFAQELEKTYKPGPTPCPALSVKREFAAALASPGGAGPEWLDELEHFKTCTKCNDWLRAARRNPVHYTGSRRGSGGIELRGGW